MPFTASLSHLVLSTTTFGEALYITTQHRKLHRRQFALAIILCGIVLFSCLTGCDWHKRALRCALKRRVNSTHEHPVIRTHLVFCEHVRTIRVMFLFKYGGRAQPSRRRPHPPTILLKQCFVAFQGTLTCSRPHPCVDYSTCRPTDLLASWPAALPTYRPTSQPTDQPNYLTY